MYALGISSLVITFMRAFFVFVLCSVLLLGTGFPSLTVSTLILLAECLGLEFVPVAIYSGEPMVESVTNKIDTEIEVTHSTACLGDGSSVVK